MSFKRLDQEDIVISTDSISAPAWTGNVVNLTPIYYNSAQKSAQSGDYYLNAYQTASSDDAAAIQFSLSFGHLKGSGSADLNTGIDGYSPSRIVYGQYRTLVNGTEESNIQFGSTTPDYIYAIAIQRARFKEKLFPGSLALSLTGPADDTITLTDDSQYTTTETFTDLGRKYNIVSGSEGVKKADTVYGSFLPDAGLILLDGPLLDSASVDGGIALNTGLTNTDEDNSFKLFNAIDSGSNFILRSEETISSNYVFVRARNSEFNYSTNPSNITGSGELRHDVMIDSPQSYITAVGLYNDNNDLLAVAKLSRPLLKDFTKEALVRIKLDY